MRRIHQLFAASDQPAIRELTARRGRHALCWYPSAGDDFRHIPYMEAVFCAKDSVYRPVVYIHTDMHLIQNWKDSRQSRPWQPGDEIARATRIVSISEITPKKRVLRVSPKVAYTSMASADIGRVFLFDLLVEVFCRGRAIQVPTPLIYFVAENLGFLAHLLLKYRLRVDTLVHIRDGGASMGESQIPMNFIYQVADILRLNRVISNTPSQTKYFNTKIDSEALFHELIEAEHHLDLLDDRLPDRMDSRSRFHERPRHHERHREIPAEEIRRVWEDRRIDPNLFERDTTFPFAPPESYYDWRRIGSYDAAATSSDRSSRIGSRRR